MPALGQVEEQAQGLSIHPVLGVVQEDLTIIGCWNTKAGKNEINIKYKFTYKINRNLDTWN